MAPTQILFSIHTYKVTGFNHCRAALAGAEAIVKKFIGSDAEYEINIEGRVRTSLEECMAREDLPAIWDALALAQKKVGLGLWGFGFGTEKGRAGILCL